MTEHLEADEAKSKAELLDELERVRLRLAELEATGGSHEHRRRVLESRLSHQNDALARLATSEELAGGDYLEFVKLATRVAAETLDVARVGLWLFDQDRSVLRCEQLYERIHDRHSAGMELQSDRYPKYFAAMERGRCVAAHDAHQDPATSEFSEGYLTSLGISSMMDAPLRGRSELIGVICHEHVGPPRVWAPEEQDFGSSVADLLALAFEGRERRMAESAFRSAQEELLRRQWQATRQVESELLKVEDELVRKTRLATIGQVAASIAHELRNPLGAMHNAVHLLERHVPADRPKWVEYLGIIRQEIGAADGILSDLLEMSRAKEPVRKEVDLGRLATEAFAYCKADERIRLQLALDPDPFTIHADPGQLRQVLANLIQNSAQAALDRGNVAIRARSDGELDEIVVADDGPGVPPEQRSRIFEPLFSSKAKGTGLGLPICKQIVVGHGGSLELVEGEGPGAMFRIRLPRCLDRRASVTG